MENWDEKRQSEFSGDVNYLNRLNSLLYICDDMSMSLDAFAWFHALLALTRELSTEFQINKKTGKNIDNEKCNVFIDKINMDISLFIEKRNRGVNEMSPELYKNLHDFEIFLRSILKTSGLQNKMKDDPRLALR